MNKQKGFTAIELFIVFVGVGSVALLGTLIYVAAHFIGKFW